MKNKTIAIILILLAAGSGLTIGVADAASLDGVDIHGFISQGYIISDEYNYLAHNSTDGSFEYNEFGINFSKNVTNRLRMGMQLFSRDLGDASNNKVTVDWANGDYRWKDWLGIRAGRIKLPLGIYNEIQDVDLLRTSIVMPQSVYPTLLRDTTVAVNGAGIYGDIPLGVVGGASYYFLAGPLTSDPDSGLKKSADSSFMGYFTLEGDTDNETAYAWSLRWEPPLPGLLLGYSGYRGVSTMTLRYNDAIPVVGGTTVESELTYFQQVLSAEFTWNDLLLSCEYKILDDEVKFMGDTQTTTILGYYLAASYRFTDLFTLGAYYSEFYPDADDKDGDNVSPSHRAWQKDLATTLRFDLNDYWILKIEGHRVDGTGDLVAADNLENDLPNDYSEDTWYYGVAKVTFSF